MGNLHGLVIVVTGASGGIGEGIALRLVVDGAKVIAAGRTAVDLEGVEWVRTDVARSDEADALVGHVVKRHGRIDVLVNNAGVLVEKTIADTTDEEFDQVMDVNVRGVFNCSRAAVRAMRDQGGGAIVNIGSTAADHADHAMAVYNASKGAVHALTRSIAIDHGPDGIRANTIAPGWIATAMADAAFDATDDPKAARSEAIGQHPVGRLGLPEDVAGLASWLASSDSAFVSGAVFTIDGGLTAQSPIGG